MKLLCLIVVYFSNVFALTPLPDTRPEFFMGDWIGVGPQNQFCFLSLAEEQRGVLIYQSATGTWRSYELKWRNSNQALEIPELKSDSDIFYKKANGLNVQNQQNGTFRILFFDSPNDNCQFLRAIDFDQKVAEAKKRLPK